MTYQAFRNSVLNKGIDVDHAFGDQCWDLVALYNEQVIGIPASQGWGLPTGPDADAKDVWLYFENPLPQYFDKIQAPFEQGDIIVWGEVIGKDGHIDIFDSPINSTSWWGLDQNWPVGSVTHLQQHNYNGILGGLRPKGDNMELINTGDLNFISQITGVAEKDLSNMGLPGKGWKEGITLACSDQIYKDHGLPAQVSLLATERDHVLYPYVDETSKAANVPQDPDKLKMASEVVAVINSGQAQYNRQGTIDYINAHLS